MSLNFDIRFPDEFERSVKSASKALEEIEKREKGIDAMAKKLNVDSKKVLQAEKLIAVKDKERAKTSAELKAKVKDIAKETRDLGLAAAASAVSFAAIGYELGRMAYDAFKGKREASALIDAFTNHHGVETMKALDAWAQKLGLSIAETRQKFVEFRQAGMDNRMSLNLIKMRADLMAVGLSAQAADKEISQVTAAGHDKFGQARAFQEISRAYGGIGDGAKAAAYATQSLAGAQNKIANAFDEKLAAFWERVGKNIGTAANRLADFMTKLLDSEATGKAIDRLVDSVNRFANAVSNENLSKVFGVLGKLAGFTLDAFEGWSHIVDPTASRKLYQQQEQIARNAAALEAKRAELAGKATSDGFANGVDASKAAAATKNMADKAAGAFTDAMGIHSPSKLFAGYGEDTVEGYQIGQRRALGDGSMPIQAAASAPPVASGPAVTIGDIHVHGGGDPTEIARAIRQEIQLLLQAGQLARGYA